MRLNCILIIIISILQFSKCANENPKETTKIDDDDDNDVFIPTREWQVVRKDQNVPKGIHVRINFETGITEAKLMDDENEDFTYEVDSKNKAVSTAVPLNKAATTDYEDLKNKLKNIKDDGGKGKKSDKRKFKSYEELKADLESLNLTPKTDAEIVSELIKQHRRILKDRLANAAAADDDDDDYLLTILQDLEYLVHQYDNANQFVSYNGFGDVILVDLNSTNVEIKLEALKLLGSSVQNNANVQIHALERGCVDVLLRVLALDSNVEVKNRAVFALSGMLRRFPLAQLKFVQSAGLSIFVALLEKTNSLKLQLKIVTLVNDLVLEHRDALNGNDSNFEKLKQYDRIKLQVKLAASDWCYSLEKVLANVIDSGVEDHDGVEKCLNAIHTAKEMCDATSAISLMERVLRLKRSYAKLAEEVDEDEMDFFDQMLTLSKDIVSYFDFKYRNEL